MNNNISVGLIDDNKPALDSLKLLIKQKYPNFQVIGEAYSVTSGVQLIQDFQPDVVFLDVELPDGSGFDLLKQLKRTDIQVIFVTAHNHYAINAFKMSALDFLLKPIELEELDTTIRKIEQKLKETNTLSLLEHILANFDRNSENKKIVLKTAQSIHLVDLKKVIRCEASNNYTIFYVTDQKKPIVVSRTLKEFETILAPYDFIRIHHSHLINIQYMDRFDKDEGGIVVMQNGTQLPVSQNRLQGLINFLKKNTF
jgi:two-component system, LytTR family, response regulator